ncbi:MAG TPA: hypothetical protein VML92_03335 [Steroidobacteraceae bacterium]|nr:hypothetical protein [Steroidobacteraceae bacterium]
MSGTNTAPDCEQLTGLVFELASQLHVERAQRVVLQAALEKAGVFDATTLQALALDPEVQRRNHDLLEESIAKLLRVLAEDADARRPLRDTDGNRKPEGDEP